MTARQLSGGCLCGAVRYHVTAWRYGGVVDCHCGQCRRFHGAPGPYLTPTDDGFRLERDDGLRWYRSSPSAERGFCGTCGASLFWRRADGTDLGVTAGTLDGPTGLRTVGHIFTGSQGDWYEIPPGPPRWETEPEG